MDMESYYNGQKDMVEYLYELLITNGVSEVIEYIRQSRIAIEGERNG